MLPVNETGNRPKRRIGRYLVTGRMGRGGMGMVYRGRDEVLDREVAIKTLTAEGVLDAESRRRFEVEAKAAARLQHPNILTVFELGEDRGMPFIAMELLPGADLESLLRSGEPMPLRERLEVVVQVLRGLAYAHEHGIVHRDIKPSNIRLLDDGTAKIMDFGIAKLGGTNLTRTGYMVGTVHYMSPEQVRAQRLDGRSDVFSVGVILYELLAGRRPFAGEAATDVLYKIAHAEPEPLSAEALGGSGARLQGIVAKALAKDPAQRYASAGAMADALSELLRDQLAAHPIASAPSDAEALLTARRLIKEGRLEDAERHVATVVQRSPELLDGRRLARAVARERARLARPAAHEPDDFPELDATHQAPATTRQPETLVAAAPPTVAVPPAGVSSPPAAPAPAAPVAGRGRSVFVGAGLALAVAGTASLLLLRGGRDAAVPRTEVAPAATPGSAATEAPAPAPNRVRVVTDPAGATVSLDGAPVPGATPLELTLAPGREHVVRAIKGGFGAAEARVAPGNVPAELRLSLEAASPPGAVAVTAPYPVDVLFKGRALLKGETAARVELPSGRQTLTLLAEKYFLRATVNVDVKPGETTGVEAPALGRVSIRAMPDNCEVSIDGIFADYPPILDRPVAAGLRTVGFKWPDGTRREEQVEVPKNALAYVVGKKD
ncbi:MAG TPA: protein kinase [Vicinamibacteria bacterium]|nr:protein kinase [Vicinamibacteria bacterium]